MSSSRIASAAASSSVSRKSPDPGLALRVAQPDEHVEPDEGIGLGFGVEQLDGLLEPADGLVGSQCSQRAVAGAPGVRGRLADLGSGGRDPVAGQLADAIAGVVAALGLEELADPSVDPRSPAGRQLVVEGVLEEGVDEGEPLRPPLHLG